MPMIELSREELVGINNALNEILHGPEAIDEVEFETRVALTREEAALLLEKVDQVIKGMR